MFFIYIIIALIFVFVISMWSCFFYQLIKERKSNSYSPKRSVEATVVTKREGTYVTFEMGDGERIEFAVSGTEHGMLVEGDYGMLTYQGTRYLGFKRM